MKTNLALFDLVHPAHVHLFRNAIDMLRQEGWQIIVTSRAKDVTLNLLDSYGIESRVLSSKKNGYLGGLWEWLIRFYKLYKMVRKAKPNIMVASAGVSVGPVSFFTGIPNLQFYDTERAKLQNMISYPLATRIFTPRAYGKKISGKHEFYDGYHELAYLRPDYFIFSEAVLAKLGVEREEKYCLLRFNCFQAVHDKGIRGLTTEYKLKALREFSKFAKVFISSEGELSEDFQDYKLPTEPQEIHQVIAGASLVFGESATMASEAAVLGVPSIFVYGYNLSCLNEQQKKYGLTESFLADKNSQQAAIEKGVAILKNSNRAAWQKKRDSLLVDTIDVTGFIVEQIKKYAIN